MWTAGDNSLGGAARLAAQTTRMPIDNETFQRALCDVFAAHAEEYPNVRSFAKAAKIASTTVYDLMAGYTRPTPRTLRRIGEVVQRDEAVRLYRAAGEAVPETLLTEAGSPNCVLARSIAAAVGKAKDEVIREALEEYAASRRVTVA